MELTSLRLWPLERELFSLDGQSSMRFIIRHVQPSDEFYIVGLTCNLKRTLIQRISNSLSMLSNYDCSLEKWCYRSYEITLS